MLGCKNQPEAIVAKEEDARPLAADSEDVELVSFTVRVSGRLFTGMMAHVLYLKPDAPTCLSGAPGFFYMWSDQGDPHTSESGDSPRQTAEARQRAIPGATPRRHAATFLGCGGAR